MINANHDSLQQNPFEGAKKPGNSNKPEKPHIYKFKVREKVFETTQKKITGKEVCEIAGLLPVENYKLDLKLKGNIYREIKPDSIVDLTEPGIEKFTYITRNQTEG